MKVWVITENELPQLAELLGMNAKDVLAAAGIPTADYEASPSGQSFLVRFVQAAQRSEATWREQIKTLRSMARKVQRGELDMGACRTIARALRDLASSMEAALGPPAN